MRILLGISGGFDSAAAAHKLIAEGHTVEGAVIVMHEYTDTAAAALACERLGIPLHVIDAKEAFENKVKKTFVSEYKNGRTPNPCVICNREVKLEALMSYAVEHGFDRMATGHYARVLKNGDVYCVGIARDAEKDQSYMLSRLSQEQLAFLVLPLCNEVKSDLREGARNTGAPLPEAKDSQEICFIPDNDHAAYVEARIGKMPEGLFLDKDGNVLGRHKGLCHYTVGQRKGLGIALGKRMFVTEIDPLENTVTLTEEGRISSHVELSDPVYSGFIPGSDAAKTMHAEVKIRYKSPMYHARVTFAENEITLDFDSPVKGAAPGQTAVIYLNGVILASGFIR